MPLSLPCNTTRASPVFPGHSRERFRPVFPFFLVEGFLQSVDLERNLTPQRDVRVVGLPRMPRLAGGPRSGPRTRHWGVGASESGRGVDEAPPPSFPGAPDPSSSRATAADAARRPVASSRPCERETPSLSQTGCFVPYSISWSCRGRGFCFRRRGRHKRLNFLPLF